MAYSGFWRRVLARLIDLLIFAPLLICNYSFLKDTNSSLFLINSYLISLIMIVYDILLIYFKGTTIGKMVLNLRVVKTDGSRVTLRNAIFRELFVFIALPISLAKDTIAGNAKIIFTIIDNLYLLFFIIEHFVYFTNPNRKTYHDYIGDTVVIIKRKQSQLPPEKYNND